MSGISIVINCTESELTDLSICLKNVSSFADEIIIIDMECGPNLLEITKKYKVKIYKHPLIPVVEPARNFGISKATNNWILIMDPDERLHPDLKLELKKLSQREDIDYVKIPRKNIIFGKWLHYTGAWPDYLIRFFKKDTVVWSSKIHTQPQIDGRGFLLPETQNMAIKHYNYKSIQDYLHKAIRYTSKRADELRKNNHTLKTSDLILKPVQEFNTRFFFQKGYKDGMSGLIFSLLQAFSEMLIYANLWEKSKIKNNHISKKTLVSSINQSIYEFGFWFTKYLCSQYTSSPIKLMAYQSRQIINRILKNT